MTHMEAMAAIAQGVINIGEANVTKVECSDSECGCVMHEMKDAIDLALFEKGSRIERGMSAIVNEEAGVIEDLKRLDNLFRNMPGGWHHEGREIVSRLLKRRTDPEFEG